MNKAIRLIISGIAGVGLADGLAAIYQTKPPVKSPNVLTVQEAIDADASALSTDFSRVYGDICRSYAKTAEEICGEE